MMNTAPSHMKFQEKCHVKVHFQDNPVGFLTLASYIKKRIPNIVRPIGVLEMPRNLDALICFQKKKGMIQNKGVPMTGSSTSGAGISVGP